MITLDQVKSACASADYQALHNYNARMRAGEALELCDAEDVRVHMQLNIKTAALCQDATITRQLVSACDALLRGAAHPFDDQQHNALTAADAVIANMQLSVHGNTGKRNAAHDVTPDSHLHIRVPTAKKAGYVKAAQASGMKLSEWVIAQLDTAAKG